MRKAIIRLCQKFGLAFTEDSVIEKRCSDVIQRSTLDGFFILRGDELLFANPIGRKILGLDPDFKLTGLRWSEQRAIPALQAVSSVIPIELSLEFDQRKVYYLIRPFSLFQDWADRFILAQDVTLIKESLEAKNQFLGTLSHEMKTPATRLLKQRMHQIQEPTFQSLLLTSAEDVDRLRVLIDDLSSVFQWNPFSQELKVQRFDLGKLLSHLLQIFQDEAYTREVQLVRFVRADERAILVPMDPLKMTWALSYLLAYGLRHTPKGGKLGAAVEVQGGVVEVKIQDQGASITSQQDQFWVPAAQGDGLGLAIAQEVILAHGGRVWIAHQPGKSVEFCFTLPLKDLNSEVTSKKMNPNSLFPLKGVSSGTCPRC